MSFIRALITFTLLLSMISSFQINLDLTDWMNTTDKRVAQRFNCLYITVSIESKKDPNETISYCMTEESSAWNIQRNNLDPNFTFADLAKLNVSSRQLYLWSAPMDIIEDYQLYLESVTTASQRLTTTKRVFYNCTPPSFGPMCQYTFDNYKSHHLSLKEIIDDIHMKAALYNPITLTCYIHLQCSLGSTSTCLDWTNICDGLIHCVNGLDEEHCWQLEINHCNDNEYRCRDGQCIPFIFLNDHFTDCLDRSDEYKIGKLQYKITPEVTIGSEDVKCFDRDSVFIRPLLKSCDERRHPLFKQAMFSYRSNLTSEKCWSAVTCLFPFSILWNSNCENVCHGQICTDIINETCPDMLYIPAVPVLFGHVYFAYTKDYVMQARLWSLTPEFICYNEQLCGGFNTNAIVIKLNNTTCRRPNDFPVYFRSSIGRLDWITSFVTPAYEQLYKCNTIIQNDSTLNDLSSMYHCINSSKFIARERLLDFYKDCDYGDDENVTSIGNLNSKEIFRTHFKCSTIEKIISRKLVRDGIWHCSIPFAEVCDDEYSELKYIRKKISFSTICDDVVELEPLLIDGRNDTDETECEQWPCNSVYTRCDGFLHCLNGTDELDCHQSTLIDCEQNQLACISPSTISFTCLPTDKINNGEIDCLGATDESEMCQEIIGSLETIKFGCPGNDNDTICLSLKHLCNVKGACKNKENEKLCNYVEKPTWGICQNYASDRSDVEEFMCSRLNLKRKPRYVSFSLEAAKYPSEHIGEHVPTSVLQPASIIEISPASHHYCHRGLNLRVWLDKKEKLSNMTCLCPPSYYGDICQYQNQRVSLTLQFRSFSDSWQTPFIFVILLIDNGEEGTIHSQQQRTYLPVQNCQTKYNIQLLYSTRPKNQSKLYSVHIDVYEKVSLSYRGSLLVPMPFQFPPVQRIAAQLDIPHTNDNFKSCSDRRCEHGHCVRYFGDGSSTTFCRCHSGWSGRYCTISYTCMCSPDALCLGVLANNRSLCLCPTNKWGSRCALHNYVCQSGENATCDNGGQCVSVDEHVVSNKKFECICLEAFHGDRCQIPRKMIILSFQKDIILPPSMFVHFIEVVKNSTPETGITFKTIPTNQAPAIIYRSRAFHIAFVELFTNNYYLITVQTIFNSSITLTTTLQPSDRCPSINELFNETIVNLHLLRRIKQYHEPCQQYQNRLSCFYDDVHFCLCHDFDGQRVANCFEFNHTMEHNCHGRSNCEHGGKCLQDSVSCPEMSMCICPTCFYGSRCQFSSSGFGLSLDSILGYHIQPGISIRYQPLIVQISVVLTAIISTIGLVNSLLSLVTFKNRALYQTGCGVYLLVLSINILITIFLFLAKFSILLIAQMTYVTNRSFLNFQCLSIDFLLQIGLNMDQWLNASVAIDRVAAVVQGVKFNKERSKKTARCIISALLCFVVGTHIQDLLYRKLIDEDYNDEKRIWCVVSFPKGITIFDTTMSVFHFFGPFIINIISASMIIIATTRSRSSARTDQTYRKLLHRQLQQHKHLIIAPIVLVILAIPRLIISLVSGCMKSIDDSWLHLAGYYVSFAPLILTFAIFVVPSKTYKTEFYKTVKNYQKTVRSGLRRIT